MIADFRVVLDACVLTPMPLADTLLRMAETPRLYLPQWSDELMAEVARTLRGKFGKSEVQIAHRESSLRRAFPEAWVGNGYRTLTPLMTNHSKDRHVLAAAAYSKSELIVTYNRKDFPIDSLERWNVRCVGPSTFLQELYGLDSRAFVQKLNQQAADIDIELPDLLERMRKHVPSFVRFFEREKGAQTV